MLNFHSVVICCQHLINSLVGPYFSVLNLIHKDNFVIEVAFSNKMRYFVLVLPNKCVLYDSV
uniref:Uncharacterized protein n=1 Tax=Arundo donax TaxID=35708 RepID=A0A0A8ZQP6_ARUDO